jgi:hypothetical protein
MMSSENIENFENFWSSFTWPEPAEVFYRLYYDSEGWPICYSMENLPHAYIEITKEQFAVADSNVQVVDGKIHHIKSSPGLLKLSPSEIGTPCDPRDICVVTDLTSPHIKWST